jgi:hypothetical protein
MLFSWEVWSERNARVFHNVATLPTIVVSKLGERQLFGAWRGQTFGFNHAKRVLLFPELASVYKTRNE